MAETYNPDYRLLKSWFKLLLIDIFEPLPIEIGVDPYRAGHLAGGKTVAIPLQLTVDLNQLNVAIVGRVVVQVHLDSIVKKSHTIKIWPSCIEAQFELPLDFRRIKLSASAAARNQT